MSLIIFAITLAFASMKYNHMIERRNPTVNINTAALESGSRITTDSEDFMLAFAAESYTTKQILNDQRYIRFYAMLRQYDEET